MRFVPYIHFNDCCAEAMAFYAEVFGGDNLLLMPYSEAPADLGFPETDRIMHASLSLGDGATLMASDNPPGMPASPQQSVSVSMDYDTVDEARRIFDLLDADGDVIMPFEENFFSQGFGMTRDKFGTHWMVMGPDKAMG